MSHSLEELRARAAAHRARTAGRHDLATLYPHLAAEWGEKNAQPAAAVDTRAAQALTGQWECPTHGSWEETVGNRINQGKNCPKCRNAELGITIHKFKEIIAGIAAHIQYLTPANIWHLLAQQELAKTPNRQRLVEFMASRQLPMEDIQRWAAGDKNTMAEAVMRGEPLAPPCPPPGAPPPAVEGRALDLTGGEPRPPAAEEGAPPAEITADQGAPGTADPEEPPAAPPEPAVRAVAVLRAGAALAKVSTAESLEYLLTSQVNRLWNLYFEAEQLDLQAPGAHAAQVVESIQGLARESSFTAEAARRFFVEHAQVVSFTPPPGYTGAGAEGRPLVLNSMQKLTALRLAARRRLGNWSGTGAGKTLAGVLAAKHLRSAMTVVVCPNNVVPEWQSKIEEYFAGTTTSIENWHTGAGRRRAEFLIMNYETFQARDYDAQLARFLRAHKKRVGLIVLDEIHHAKRREGQGLTLRREGVLALLAGAPAAARLAMSATPIVNDLEEGANLIEMLTDVNPLKSTTKTVGNCVELNRALVEHGIRWQPRHGVEAVQPKLFDATRTPPPAGTLVFDDPSASGKTVARIWASNIVPVDVTPHRDEIFRRCRLEHDALSLEQILTIMRTPAISAAVAPGEKVIIYSMLRGGGIMEALVGKMRAEGHGVLVYDGEQERDIKKDVLRQFTTMGPNTPNVLLCTDAMATGIDRLQYVCSKVIFNILPWTFAQYEQLIGRVWRQGQRQQVEVVLPIPYVRTASGRVWSYDMSKLRRLFDKRTLADAAVNGNLPDHLLEDQAKMRGRLRRALESWSGQDLIAD